MAIFSIRLLAARASSVKPQGALSCPERARKQRAHAVTVHALDVHTAVPTSAQDLRDAARVVALGLVGHGGQCALHLPGFDEDHVGTGCLRAVRQLLRDRSRLQVN